MRSLVACTWAPGSWLQIYSSVNSLYILLGHFAGQWLISGFYDWIIRLVCSYKSFKTSCVLSPPVRYSSEILNMLKFSRFTATFQRPQPENTPYNNNYIPTSQLQSAFALSPTYTIYPTPRSILILQF